MEEDVERLSKVLCAVNIDDSSRRVFAEALALARSHDAKLYVLHAASPHVPLNRDATARVDFLRQLRALAEAAGIDVRVEVQRGPVAEIIVLHARARRPDLIVMGMSGSDRPRRVSGWVAEQVVREAPCPTLIVPTSAAAVPQTFGPILCAVDFSPASQAAVAEALRFASHGRRHLTLLHVLEGDDRQVASEKLRSLLPPPQRGVVPIQVVHGSPVREILRAVAAVDASLLVVGAGGRTRVGSRLFGKTGTLLRDATCPVLAVPIAASADTGIDGGDRKAA
jgi:nucleotide-binding universal stress UspA family protein